MGKISLNNIADELAAKSGITHDAANSFMHAFMETIAKGLEKDGMVKIKGLGTFKLMEVNERGSVDVNTGERIVIKGYRKVAFTPDSAMKELVNRPFAHFEPTELNDGYPTEEEAALAEAAAGQLSAVEEDEEMTAVAEEELSEVQREEPVAETPMQEEQHVDKESETLQVHAVKETVSAKRKKRGGCGCLLFSLFVIIILTAPFAFLYFYTMNSSDEVVTEEHGDIVVKPDLEKEFGTEWDDDPKVTPSQPIEKRVDSAVSLIPSTVSVEKKDEPKPAIAEKSRPAITETAKPAANEEFCVVPISESLQRKTVKDITPSDTTDYIMDGTLLTHKLKSGETIISLAKRYYGDKRLWPYIVKYNNIKDFDKVAIGQVIAVPILKEKR